MSEGDDDLEIPKFLRRSEKERKEAWEKNSPKPAVNNREDRKMSKKTEEKLAIDTPLSNVPSSGSAGRETPGMRRLRASEQAEEIRQGVLADQEEALDTAKKEREDMTATARKKSAGRPSARKTAAGKKTTARKASNGASRTRMDPSLKIKMLVKDNPRREGTGVAKQFEIARKSGTVGAYLKAGGTMGSLKKCIKNKWIAVS